MRVDIYEGDSYFELERKVNDWLEKHEGKYAVKDIKYTARTCGYGSAHNAMIIYERRVL